MIQATNAHIRRLFNEKVQAEEELQECKERVKNSIQKVIDQRKYLNYLFSILVNDGDDRTGQTRSLKLKVSLVQSLVILISQGKV